MFLILFQKHPQLLAQRVGKIVRKLAQPFSLPLLSHNLIRRKCLTFRRSRPPAAAAELRALVPPYSRFMQARIYSSASPFSSVFPLGFWPCGGLRLGLVRFFKPFRPLALAQQALVAIILQVLRRFRGAALFRSVRPSSTWGFPFWPMGLTVQSSRPAYGGRLTFGVRAKISGTCTLTIS